MDAVEINSLEQRVIKSSNKLKFHIMCIPLKSFLSPAFNIWPAKWLVAGRISRTYICVVWGDSAQRVAISAELYYAFLLGIFHVRTHFQPITWTHHLRIRLCIHHTRCLSQKGIKKYRGKSNYSPALCDARCRATNFSSDSNKVPR
jgi:hypothetical protein